MPVSPPPPFPDEAKFSPRHANVPSWLREPLVHFLVLGGLLFALDHTLVGRTDNPRTILVDAKVDGEAREVFKASRGREPNEAELYALRRVWLDNEVLYREGLALGVDKGDTAIRERVIFKMLSIVDAGLKLPPIDDKQLREWFEKNRVKYDEPARYDFQEAVLSGDRSEAATRAFVETLHKGTPGELNAGLRVFKGRPHSNIVQGYGEEFAKALEESPPGEWHAQRTRDGWRATRLESITPPKPAVYETLRGVVLQDWTDAIMAEQRSAAVRALTRKYTVKVEPVNK
ncbi:MAG TPA: peptidylprolyl isomerase [Burkholderiales bacterium]|nr:peptidylprolyl isomerase [Burkholderiales bacterium]